MAENSTKKMGFWRRMLSSIKDFEQYQTFALEGIGKAVKYLLLLVLLFTAIMGGVFTYQFSTMVQDTTNYVKNNLTQITYQNGILNINENALVSIENEQAMLQKVIIATGATKEQEEEYKKELEKYPSGILLLNNKLIFRNDMVSTNTEYTYQDILTSYGVGDFTKEEVVTMINGANYIALYVAFFITMLIYLFAVYTTSTLVDVFVLAGLGFIIARIAGMRIKLKATFNMGVHALTLPILLNLIYIIVNNFTGFEIKYFQWMYTTISCIYLIVAILMIKTDLVNRKMEVMKIQEVQEQVREELENQEEKKQENKETGKDKEEQPVEKKEENNEQGEEPEGSKA